MEPGRFGRTTEALWLAAEPQVRYVNAVFKYIVIILGLFCSTALAQDIEIEVDDCGPLGRGELGVVFSLKPHGSGVSYFAKGPAMEVCTKLIKAKRVIGYEEPYCKNYEPVHPKECEHIKVFVIKDFIFE